MIKLQRIINRINLGIKLNSTGILKNFKKFMPENQFIIFSDPRGGSTWLAEMLSTIPTTALIWEPLNIGYMNQFRDLGFGWRQYIPENVIWPEALNTFNQVLGGKILNEWTLLKTSTHEYLFANQLIFKICRGNMLLPWITRHFDFNFQPIYLVRHPFAVVNSQLQQGGWDQSFQRFEVPDMPFNDIYKNHGKFLTSLSSKEELLVAHWCITNRIPLTHKMNNINWITIFYENLLSDPEKEIRRIFNRWDIELPATISKMYRQSSSTAGEDVPVIDIDKQLSKWQRELNTDQLSRMNAVLQYFKVEWYDHKSILPLCNYS